MEIVLMGLDIGLIEVCSEAIRQASGFIAPHPAN